MFKLGIKVRLKNIGVFSEEGASQSSAQTHVLDPLTPSLGRPVPLPAPFVSLRASSLLTLSPDSLFLDSRKTSTLKKSWWYMLHLGC